MKKIIVIVASILMAITSNAANTKLFDTENLGKGFKASLERQGLLKLDLKSEQDVAYIFRGGRLYSAHKVYIAGRYICAVTADGKVSYNTNIDSSNNRIYNLKGRSLVIIRIRANDHVWQKL